MEKRESFSTPRVSAQSKFATFSTSRIENRERARKKTFFFAPLFPSGYFMLYHFFPICLVTCISKTFFPPLKALSFSVRPYPFLHSLLLGLRTRSVSGGCLLASSLDGAMFVLNDNRKLLLRVLIEIESRDRKWSFSQTLTFISPLELCESEIARI